MSVQLACSYESHTLELNCAGAENTCEYIYFSKLWCNRGLSYSAITTTHIQIVSYPKSKFPVQEIRATLHSHTSTCQNHRTEIFFHFTTIFCSFPYKWLAFHSLNKVVQSMHDLHHVETPQRRNSQLMEQTATDATNRWWTQAKNPSL
jgi:hypothetical protein